MEILERARAAFDAYLDRFDREDPKVRLKIVHTDGVVAAARRISEGMGLGEEDAMLAELIALLHDIGRFEQLRLYDSFEPSTMDHAAYGVEILSKNGHAFLRSFVEEEGWDEIILQSVGYHSLYELPPIEDERILLHSRLIRDADKLDNCRVKLVDSLDILLGMDPVQVGQQRISEKVWEQCLERKAIYSPDRERRIDYWVSYIAYFFDIYFPSTARIILEEDFCRRVAERLPYGNPETAEKMEKLVGLTEEYLRELAGRPC